MEYNIIEYNYKKDISNISEAITNIYNKSPKTRGKYLPLVASFDIETTAIEKTKNSYMYIWQFSLNNDLLVYGRTWKDYECFTTLLVNLLGLSDKKILLIGVHNLSFEFQFIRKRFNWSSVFALDERKPLYCIDERGIEYTCTYLMSGLSLKKLGTETKKLKYNYSKIRNSKTPLSADELHYCFNDVIIVVEYLHRQIKTFGSVKDIPRTITGVVRNYIKKKAKENKEKFDYLSLLPGDTLELLTIHNSFCGGFTHSNPYNTCITFDNVNSFDLTSAYPCAMVSQFYPRGNSTFVKHFTLDLVHRSFNEKLSIFVVKFRGLRNIFECDSYLSESKCKLEGETIVNGRVYKATTCITTTTSVDFAIIERCYKWDSIEFFYGYMWNVDYLPLSYFQSVQEFYKAKTELKDVENREEEYFNKKGMLNSLYGMCVTNEFKNEITYNAGCWGTSPVDVNVKLSEMKNSTRFTAYVYGVFVTAYVRLTIWNVIFKLGQRYIYSDTDSVKFIGDDFTPFEEYNQTITKSVVNAYEKRGITWNGSYKTIKGDEKPLGVFEYEGKYDKFKTLGAKKYLYYKDGKYNCAVAGCPKDALISVVCDKGNPFDNFKNGLYIPPDKSKKLCHYYKDEPHSEMVDGELMTELSSVCLLDTDFTIGISPKYLKFIYIINNCTASYLKEINNYVLWWKKNINY